jgi:hypothetical protein
MPREALFESVKDSEDKKKSKVKFCYQKVDRIGI